MDTVSYMLGKRAGGGGASYTAGTNINIDSNNAINCAIPFRFRNDDPTSNGFMLGRHYMGTGLTADAIVIGANHELTSSASGIAIGSSVRLGSSYTLAIGNSAKSNHQYSIALGHQAETTKTHQMMVGGQYGRTINEIAMYTDNGVKVIATEDYVDNLVGNINTILATLTTPSNGGNA